MPPLNLRLYRFQSTPPLKAVTVFPPKGQQCLPISIHTAPKGGDEGGVYSITLGAIFQSTPPLKAVTAGDHSGQRIHDDFNPHRP